jgi:hypothetical protein
MIAIINGAKRGELERRMLHSIAMIIRTSKRIDLKDRADQEGGPCSVIHRPIV